MGIKPSFDREKAIECILFLANHEPNTYELLKLLYFAEKIHLARYGRLITGDSYVAMKSGPVPSSCYDVLKLTVGYPGQSFGCGDNGFHMNSYYVEPERDCDFDSLSESDIECLKESVEKFGNLSAAEKKRLSHDEAYEAYFGRDGANTTIPLKAIAETLPNSEDVLEHLGY